MGSVDSYDGYGYGYCLLELLDLEHQGGVSGATAAEPVTAERNIETGSNGGSNGSPEAATAATALKNSKQLNQNFATISCRLFWSAQTKVGLMKFDDVAQSISFPNHRMPFEFPGAFLVLRLQEMHL